MLHGNWSGVHTEDSRWFLIYGKSSHRGLQAAPHLWEELTPGTPGGSSSVGRAHTGDSRRLLVCGKSSHRGLQGVPHLWEELTPGTPGGSSSAGRAHTGNSRQLLVYGKSSHWGLQGVPHLWEELTPGAPGSSHLWEELTLGTPGGSSSMGRAHTGDSRRLLIYGKSSHWGLQVVPPLWEGHMLETPGGSFSMEGHTAGNSSSSSSVGRAHTRTTFQHETNFPVVSNNVEALGEWDHHTRQGLGQRGSAKLPSALPWLAGQHRWCGWPDEVGSSSPWRMRFCIP
nr:uncharacterized protein LOC105487603 isoform X1 [Macaca nemestrina]XP_024650440.1 uncharacterized protein LOC105487603 isoform X1 [Macaca nemestrina]XP_024650441.1 uncharacterized protein LOC105487603 isoform X1 [Macaca nemestrina]